MVLLLHGVVVVEVQKDDLFTVSAEEGVYVHETVSDFVAKQPMDEVDFMAFLARFGRDTEVKIANAPLQLLSEGEVLSHRPLLHHLLSQQAENSSQVLNKGLLIGADWSFFVHPKTEGVMGP